MMGVTPHCCVHRSFAQSSVVDILLEIMCNNALVRHPPERRRHIKRVLGNEKRHAEPGPEPCGAPARGQAAYCDAA